MIRLFWASAVLISLAGQADAGEAPVVASVESSLHTEGKNVRQLAMDGDPSTFFASDKPAAKDDHFTVVLDSPVKVTAIAVASGKADGADALEKGVIQVSTDGTTFEDVAKVSGRDGKADLGAGRTVKAVRLRLDGDLGHPLLIREITLTSDPAVVTFRWPVEFVVDVTDAPEMKGWAEKAATACVRAYPMICEELKSDGYVPPRLISMTLKSSYKGVAEAGGTRITGSVKFFTDHPDDIGAMVHETTHVVQRYRGRGNPSWLVEGVSDYVRFFKYEPGKIGRIDPDRARYNASYRTTAAFLAYVSKTYDPDLVRKLNKSMREGTYREEQFKEFTGKTVKDLGDEWKATLKK
jgi:Peptidase of plants and bacteria/F5/8 type C domain